MSKTPLIEILMVMTTASIVVGGISVNIDDILAETTDTARVANLRQIATAIELYYSDYGAYPEGDFKTLISTLSEKNYLASLPNALEKYEYQALNKGQNYILKVRLETSESHFFENSPCQPPYYCIKM